MSEMKFNLKKGMKFNFKKERPSLKKVRVTLQWTPQTGSSRTGFDADLSIVALRAIDETTREIFARDERWVIYYGSEEKRKINGVEVISSPNGEIIHWGDNRDGAFHNGVEGEQAEIDFSALPEGIAEIAILGTIFEGQSRNQNWNKLKATVKIEDIEKGDTVLEYAMEDKEDVANMTAILPGSFVRVGPDEWEFVAIGKGEQADLGDYLNAWS